MNCHPLAGELPDWLSRYSADTPMGRLLRQGDAKLMLKRMEEAEADYRRQEEQRLIVDRFQRIHADQRLQAEYLLQFGVPLSNRGAFRETLTEVALHGGMMLSEAAVVADEITNSDQKSNGLSGAGGEPELWGAPSESGSEVLSESPFVF